MLPLCFANATAASEALKENGARADGRRPLEYRQIQILFNEANGSTEVSIGRTRVCCELTAAPVPLLKQQNTATEGSISVHVSFSPAIAAAAAAAAGAETAAAAEAASGRQQQTTKQQERQLELLLKRLLKDGGLVSFEALAIAAGRWAWQLNACLTVLSNDGNIIDVSLLSLLASLLSFNLCCLDSRTLELLQEQQQQQQQQQEQQQHLLQRLERTPLCLLHCPLAVSVAYAAAAPAAAPAEQPAGDTAEQQQLQQQQQQHQQQQEFCFVIDPTALEEAFLPGRVLVCLCEDQENIKAKKKRTNSKRDLLFLQKTAGPPLNPKDLEQIIDVNPRP